MSTDHPCVVTINHRSKPRVLFSGDKLIEVDLPSGYCLRWSWRCCFLQEDATSNPRPQKLSKTVFVSPNEVDARRYESCAYERELLVGNETLETLNIRPGKKLGESADF